MKKNELVPCIVCSEEIEKDHLGIKCNNDGHDVCPECSPNFVFSIFEENIFPPKCF